jgi:2-polyprenyl-3-methyl-5-hydroxy-6-metoxy-1,4-benzoquinol methylase
VLTPELMDDPGLEPALLAGALRGLGRLNAVSMAGGLLWRVVVAEARRADRPIRVLDVACASGEWVVRAAARTARVGVRAEFSGCDVNPRLVDLARQKATDAGVSCEFFAHDAVAGGAMVEYDVVMASLFMHHLSDEDAGRVLASMARAARRAVVINDLVRSRVNLWMVSAASRALSRSSVVHVDAALSVRAAFTRDELRGLAERAELHGATIGPGGLGRMMLVHRRGA